MFVEQIVEIMKLSKSEEELMNHLWKLKKAIMKDLVNAYQDPKPATTTIATLLKRMQIKQLNIHELIHNHHIFQFQEPI